MKRNWCPGGGQRGREKGSGSALGKALTGRRGGRSHFPLAGSQWPLLRPKWPSPLPLASWCQATCLPTCVCITYSLNKHHRCWAREEASALARSSRSTQCWGGHSWRAGHSRPPCRLLLWILEKGTSGLGLAFGSLLTRLRGEEAPGQGTLGSRQMALQSQGPEAQSSCGGGLVAGGGQAERLVSHRKSPTPCRQTQRETGSHLGPPVWPPQFSPIHPTPRGSLRPPPGPVPGTTSPLILPLGSQTPQICPCLHPHSPPWGRATGHNQRLGQGT